MIRRVILALTLPALLAACVPTTSPTTSSPAPSYQCTPEAGGSATPCSQQQYDDMKRKDALYAEAETVFRRLTAEDERTAKLGGADELTPEYEALLGTEELRTQQTAILRADKKDGVRMISGAFKIEWIRRRPGVSMNGSVVSLEGCVDMASAVYVEKGKPGFHGDVLVETIHFGPVEGSLRAVQYQFRAVTKCAG